MGGIPPRPRRSEAPPPCSPRAEPRKKVFFSFYPHTKFWRGGLEEKIGRAQIKKCEENFFAGWRALASGGGAERQNSQSGPEGPRPQFEGGAYGVKFSSKKVRILTKRHRQLVKEEFGSPATRARQPFLKVVLLINRVFK